MHFNVFDKNNRVVNTIGCEVQVGDTVAEEYQFTNSMDKETIIVNCIIESTVGKQFSINLKKCLDHLGRPMVVRIYVDGIYQTGPIVSNDRTIQGKIVSATTILPFEFCKATPYDPDQGVVGEEQLEHGGLGTIRLIYWTGTQGDFSPGGTTLFDKTTNQKALATKKNILATNSMQYGKEQPLTESNSFRKFKLERKYAVITFSYKSAEILDYMDIKPLPQIPHVNPESQIAQSSITPGNKSKHKKETETRKRPEVIVLSDDEIEEKPKLKKPKVEIIEIF